MISESKMAKQEGRTTGVGQFSDLTGRSQRAREAESTAGIGVFRDTGKILFSLPGAKLQL